MTVVKVQRPLAGEPLWLVYDKFKARQCLFAENELPISVVKVFNAAPERSLGWLKQYFDGAVWDQDNKVWSLDNVKPVTRRLIW